MINHIKGSFHDLFHRPEGRSHSLDGLRAFCLLWVIGFHVIWFLGFYLSQSEYRELIQETKFMLVPTGYVSIDVFFVLSGFLMGGIVFREFYKKGCLNFKNFYYRRAMRLFPPYLVMVPIAIFFMPYSPDITSNIWANILSVNNYIPLQQQFMGWTWSLAIEGQFYLVLPLFIYFMFRFLKKEHHFLFLVGVFFLAFLIRWIVITTGDYDLSILKFFHFRADGVKFFKFFNEVFDQTHTRFGALVPGVILAFLWSAPPFKNKVARIFGSNICLAMSLLVILVAGFFPLINYLSGSAIEIYVVFHRYIFCVAVAYLMGYMLIFKDSPLTKFWSHRFWYPIAQISYSAYLIHPIVITFLYIALGDQLDLSLVSILLYVFSVFFVTAILSAMLYVLVERPFLRMR